MTTFDPGQDAHFGNNTEALMCFFVSFGWLTISSIATANFKLGENAKVHITQNGSLLGERTVTVVFAWTLWVMCLVSAAIAYFAPEEAEDLLKLERSEQIKSTESKEELDVIALVDTEDDQDETGEFGGGERSEKRIQLEQGTSEINNSARYTQSARTENGDDEIQPTLAGSRGRKRGAVAGSLVAGPSSSARHASELVRLNAVRGSITQLDESLNPVLVQRNSDVPPDTIVINERISKWASVQKKLSQEDVENEAKREEREKEKKVERSEDERKDGMSEGITAVAATSSNRNLERDGLRKRIVTFRKEHRDKDKEQ